MLPNPQNLNLLILGMSMKIFLSPGVVRLQHVCVLQTILPTHTCYYMLQLSPLFHLNKESGQYTASLILEKLSKLLGCFKFLVYSYPHFPSKRWLSHGVTAHGNTWILKQQATDYKALLYLEIFSTLFKSISRSKNIFYHTR